MTRLLGHGRIEHLTLGPTPHEEECAQLGEPDYHERSRKETRRFVELIRRKLGPEPEGAELTTRLHPHDFGSYREVVVEFEVGNRAAEEYALRVERECPVRWDKEGTS